MEESDLLQKLKEGNKLAFNHLLALYRDKVINTCYRFLLDQADAEVASQKGFIKVYQLIKFFRDNAKLSIWVYRIALSKITL